MKYSEIKEKPQQFESLSGLSVSQFESFHSEFEKIYNDYFQYFTFEGKTRNRIKSKRKDGVLSDTRNALLFILSYIKNNPLQEYIAAQYGLSQPQANRWIHLLLDLVHKALLKSKNLPARAGKDLKIILKDIQCVFIDGTERPVLRSTDYETQKEHYSGKKKDIV
jgi:hypothetical protein